MQYLALVVFGTLALVGMVRPSWALVLLLVMFANEVGLQASVGIFRAYGFLANVLVAMIVAMATFVVVVRQPRPMLGYLTPSLAIVTIILFWSVLSLFWTPADLSQQDLGGNIIVRGAPDMILCIFLGSLLVGSVAEWRHVTTVMLVFGTLVAFSIVGNPEFSIRSGRIGVALDDGIYRTSPLAIAQMGGMLAIFASLSTGGKAHFLLVFIRVAAFICGAMLALLSGTRGQSLFAIMVIFLFLPVSRRMKNLFSYFSLVIVATIILMLAYLVFDYTQGQVDTSRWGARDISDSTYIRQSSVMSLLSAFLQSPPAWFIGLGYNAFSEVSEFGDIDYVHNVFAEILCELGIPMFLLLVIFFYRTARSGMSLFQRYRHQPAERSAVSILFAMVAFQALIHMKEGNLWTSWNLFLFSLLITRLDIRERELGDAAADSAGLLEELDAHEDEGWAPHEPPARQPQPAPVR